MNKSNITSLGIYVHIPFCEKKCKYCAFQSYTNYNEEFIEKYVLALEQEILTNAMDIGKKYYVDSIFIGGGTPSILSTYQIERILSAIKNNFILTSDAEITIESNPNSLNEFKLVSYEKMGINRLSVGIQSLNDKTLKNIGRVHNRKIALNVLKYIQDDFNGDVNYDLMFGIPGQQEDELIKNISEILDFTPTHLSIYRLQLEENTPFYTQYKNEELDLIDEDKCNKIYFEAIDYLKKYNFEQYEISNFALNGSECQHNIKYWTMQEYLGIGLGSSSYLMGNRAKNIMDFEEYFKQIDDGGSGLDINEVKKESLNSAYGTYVFTRLRTNEGIDLETFEEDFGIPFKEVYKDKIEFIENQVKLGNVIFNDNVFALSVKGFLISNNIMCEFILED